MPPLLPLSPMPEQENRSLELNSNGIKIGQNHTKGSGGGQQTQTTTGKNSDSNLILVHQWDLYFMGKKYIWLWFVLFCI